MNLFRNKHIKTYAWQSFVLVAFVGMLLPTVVLVAKNASAQVVCPCSMFGASDLPVNPTVANESTPIELGMRFRPAASGYVTGVRFYKDSSMTDVHTGNLWSSSGSLLASGTFTNETATGWQDLTFTTPVPVTAGSLYVASYFTPTGKYILSGAYFTQSVTNYPLTAPDSDSAWDALGNRGNGVFAYGGDTYPKDSFNKGNYWVDVTFRQTLDGHAPQVTAMSPTNGATEVFTGANTTATFDQDVESSTVNTNTVKLTDSQNKPIAANVSYSSSTKTVTLSPSVALDEHKVYTVSIRGGVSGVANLDGTPLASDYQWSFTTGGNSCPCSIWSRIAPTGDPVTYVGSGGEVFGQTIHAEENGYLKAVRFYKPLRSTDTTHPVHVWSTSGVLLASATSSHETSYGWQEVQLPIGVPVAQGTNYIISYYSNDNIYTYSDNVMLTEAGTGPIRANANGSVYKPSAGDVFPSVSDPDNAKVSFWLDAVFTTSNTYTEPFTLAMSQPSNGGYGFKANKPLTFTMTNAVNPATIAGAVSLKDAANNTVAGSTSYDDTEHTITFTPSQPLSGLKKYTASLATSLEDVYGTNLAVPQTVSFTSGAALSTDINQGLGGPVLVLTSATNPYGTYLAEMLRAEGINYFTVKDVSQISASTLGQYKLVLLGKTAVSAPQVSELTAWVQAGGNLIAMQPDKQLAGLLGLTDQNQTLNEGYLKVDATQDPGKGITPETMQYHLAADIYTASQGTQTVATLYADASTPRTNPAVTQRTVGTGHAAAFLYDLPKSIALMHQGNPAWAGQERDANGPIRPNDLFNGSGGTDWLNTAKAHIPQADEQQRLLTNMMLNLTKQTSPMPRFWVLPHGYKTALVMVEDDHSSGGSTYEVFDRLLNNSTTNCSFSDWQCKRSGSLMYSSAGLTPAQAVKAHYHGFTIGDHVDTGCGNYASYAGLNAAYTTQIAAFRAKYSGVPAQRVSRTHCYVWSDWDSTAKADVANGIRYNLNYEWYPPTWTGSNKGYLTGSGMNMRFTDVNGNLLDDYQGVTDLDYETDPTSATMNADLDNALNANEFYGVFGTHYDVTGGYEDLLLAAAKARNVPLISADQMVTWKDALGSSTFANISSSASNLSFTVQVAEGGEGMQSMIPLSSGNGALTALKQGTSDVSYTTSTVKGVAYAVFDAVPGDYQATYGTPVATAPVASPVVLQKTSSKVANTNVSNVVANQAIASITSETPFTSSNGSGAGTASGSGNEATAKPNKPSSHQGVVSVLVKYVGGGFLVAGIVGGGVFLAARMRARRMS